MNKLILVSFLAGCSGPAVYTCHERGTVPYTHERPTVPFRVTLANNQGVDSWNADGAPTVLTVHNPTDRYLQVHVVCNPSVSADYIDRGHIEWWTCVAPHQDKARLVEFMNIDALRGDTCHVEQYSPSTPSTCFEQE